MSLNGEAPEEALRQARDAIEGYLEVCGEDGLPVPRPHPAYTEELTVRVPKDLHRALTKRAEQAGMSLNELVSALLSGSAR